MPIRSSAETTPGPLGTQHRRWPKVQRSPPPSRSHRAPAVLPLLEGRSLEGLRLGRRQAGSSQDGGHGARPQAWGTLGPREGALLEGLPGSRTWSRWGSGAGRTPRGPAYLGHPFWSIPGLPWISSLGGSVRSPSPLGALGDPGGRKSRRPRWSCLGSGQEGGVGAGHGRRSACGRCRCSGRAHIQLCGDHCETPGGLLALCGHPSTRPQGQTAHSWGVGLGDTLALEMQAEVTDQQVADGG